MDVTSTVLKCSTYRTLFFHYQINPLGLSNRNSVLGTIIISSGIICRVIYKLLAKSFFMFFAVDGDKRFRLFLYSTLFFHYQINPLGLSNRNSVLGTIIISSGIICRVIDKLLAKSFFMFLAVDGDTRFVFHI